MKPRVPSNRAPSPGTNAPPVNLLQGQVVQPADLNIVFRGAFLFAGHANGVDFDIVYINVPGHQNKFGLFRQEQEVAFDAAIGALPPVYPIAGLKSGAGTFNDHLTIVLKGKSVDLEADATRIHFRIRLPRPKQIFSFRQVTPAFTASGDPKNVRLFQGQTASAVHVFRYDVNGDAVTGAGRTLTTRDPATRTFPNLHFFAEPDPSLVNPVKHDDMAAIISLFPTLAKVAIVRNIGTQTISYTIGDTDPNIALLGVPGVLIEETNTLIEVAALQRQQRLKSNRRSVRPPDAGGNVGDGGAPVPSPRQAPQDCVGFAVDPML